MTENRARNIVKFMMCIMVFMGLNYTFVEQNIIFALMSISGFFSFQFALEHPKLLTAKTWKEYCEHADSVESWDKLVGTPLYFFLVFCSVLYIILV